MSLAAITAPGPVVPGWAVGVIDPRAAAWVVTALPVAAAVVVLGAAALGAGPPARDLAGVPARRGRDHPSPTVWLGGRLRRAAGRPVDRSADRAVGRVAIGALAAALVAPALAPAVVGLGWAGGVRRRRVVARRRSRELVDELPDVVDLLRLAVDAGLTVPLAVAAVAQRGTGRVAAELARVGRATELGVAVDDALTGVVDALGEPVRPVIAALLGGLRDGVPVGPALERVGAELRVDRRRAADIRARRLPVTLLAPLVGCVLPAFGLLTVVPVLAAALRALPT